MTPAEDYSSSEHKFSAPELREIRHSESRRDNPKHEDSVYHPFSSWNVNDGRHIFRDPVLKECFSAFPSHIIMLQELPRTPVQGRNPYCTTGIGNKQHSVKKEFIEKYYGEEFANKTVQAMKDPCSNYAYFGTFIENEVLEFLPVPDDVVKQRDRCIERTYHQKLLISYVKRLNQPFVEFLLLNIHSPRWESAFNKSILRLVSELSKLRYVVMFAGDFNDDLFDAAYALPENVCICVLEDDVNRSKRIDFVGFSKSSQFRLENVESYNTVKDREQFTTNRFWHEIQHYFSSFFNRKILNHPHIRGKIRLASK